RRLRGGFRADRRAPCRAAPRWSRRGAREGGSRYSARLACEQGYVEVVSEHLFLFVQLEFPWELGPPDGRYLLRARAGADPERVVVLGTLGASLRTGWRGQRPRRAARGRAVDPEPEASSVPTSRATIIDPEPVSAERQ